MKTGNPALTTVEYFKGKCVHCDGPIEFQSEQCDSVAECPHCGKPTVLRIPVWSQSDSKRRRKLLKLLIGLGVIAVVLSPIFFFRIEIGAAIDTIFHGTGSLALGLVGFVCILAIALWAALWLLVPFVIYYGFRDLKRLLEEILAETRRK